MTRCSASPRAPSSATGARRQLTPEHRFKTRAEMLRAFRRSAGGDRQHRRDRAALRLSAATRKPILPRFSSAAGDAEDEAPNSCAAGGGGARRAARRARRRAGPFDEDDYRERLAFELDVIIKMGFPGYFLIVADFIKWAKAQGIPVGPGRGSGAGSLVAWALTITDLDPLRFGLLFERFLNPERVSMPDFDIDFCQDRRDEVIRYVRERYGADRVAQIITFGTLLARGVMRDVGRVLDMPLGQVDKLAKLVPNNPANAGHAEAGDRRRAAAAAMRAEDEPRVAQMLEIALQLEGLYSNASTHAAGVVIGDRPLERAGAALPRSEIGHAGDAVQHEMGRAGGPGEIRFSRPEDADDACRRRSRLAGAARHRRSISPTSRSTTSKTYEMLGRGETVGVFQLESAGMREALVEMRADRFEDIIALVALYRPGPMANIPTYCAAQARRGAAGLHRTRSSSRS